MKGIELDNELKRRVMESKVQEEGDRIDTPEFGKLLDQIEATRQDLAAHPTVNYSALISWLVKQARDRKLLSKRARR